MVSERIARSDAACARPRPSASASARLAKTTVSHSQTVTVNVNQAGSSPPPSGWPPNSWINHAIVVMSAPTSTTNMTGLRTCTRGSSFLNEAPIAGHRMSGVNRDFERRGVPVGRGRRRCLGRGHRASSARLSLVTLTPGSPSRPRKRPSVLSWTS